MKKIILIFAFLCSSAHATELKIRFTQLDFDGGNLLVNIFDKQDGFPDDFEKAIFSEVYELKKGSSFYDVLIKTLPEGRYGIAVVQDLNKNNKLDKNFFGIPSEPLGFSQNPRLKRNIKFDEVSFDLPIDGSSQVVILKPVF